MADKKDISKLSVIGKSIVSTNIGMAAMCAPYSEIDSKPPPPARVSKSLMEENVVLMAEARAKVEAKAKAEAEINEKPLMRGIEPYDDTPKIRKDEKKIEKIKKLYGF